MLLVLVLVLHTAAAAAWAAAWAAAMADMAAICCCWCIYKRVREVRGGWVGGRGGHRGCCQNCEGVCAGVLFLSRTPRPRHQLARATMADGGKVSPQLAEFIQQEQAKAQVRRKDAREARKRGGGLLYFSLLRCLPF
jgi:hypothetical protein